MMQLLHTGLETVILVLLLLVLMKLENMHRAIDRLAGTDQDAEPALDEPSESV